MAGIGMSYAAPPVRSSGITGPSGGVAPDILGGNGGSVVDPKKPKIDANTIRQLLGGGGGGNMNATQVPIGGPPTVPTAPVPSAPPQPTLTTSAPITPNTAAPNPVSNSIIDELRNRKKGFGDLDQGIQDIRDRGIAGSKGSQLSRIARGVSGSGVDSYDAGKQGDEERNQINRMTTDFSLGREKENYNESMGIANLGLAQSGQQLQATGQAAGIAATTRGLDLQAQGMANQQANAQTGFGLQAQQIAQNQANHVWTQQQQQHAQQQNAQSANLQVLLNLLS